MDDRDTLTDRAFEALAEMAATPMNISLERWGELSSAIITAIVMPQQKSEKT